MKPAGKLAGFILGLGVRPWKEVGAVVKASYGAILLLVLLAAAGCAQLTPVATEEATFEIPSGIVEEMDLQQLITAADFILVGSVGEINSDWNPERTRIHTDVRVPVEKCLKGGSRPSEVTIRFPGGQVGEIAQSVSSAPQFEMREEVVVFLEYGEEDTLRLVGGFQGKFTLREERVVGRDVPQESFLSQIGEIMREAGISPGACTGD